MFFSDSLNGGSTYVYNLFGDGQNAFVFTVQTFSIQLAIFAAHSVKGKIQIDKIRDWEQHSFVGTGNYYSFTNFEDLDGNGIPELGVVITKGRSGTPQHWSQKLWLYEWDPVNKKFDSDSVNVYNQDCDIDGPCKGEWRVVLNKNGQQFLVVTEFLFTLKTDYSETPLCSYLNRQTSYLWNRKKLIFQDESILPPQSGSKACEIAWAYTVLSEPSGWKNDFAIQTLSNDLLDWPAEMNDAWGKASIAYFQFKLGLWRDFRGETDQALELLKALPQKSQFLNLITSTYLEEREKMGFLSACQKVNQLQFEANQGKYPVDLISEWGFGSNLWIYDIPDLCDEKSAIESLLTRGSFVDTKDLETLLSTNHLNWSEVQNIPIPDANLNVWLVAINGTQDEGKAFATDILWMIVRTSRFVKAEQILDSFRTATADVAKLQLHLLDIPGQSPIVVVRFADTLDAFQVMPDANIRELLPFSELYSTTDFQVVQESQPEILVWTDQGYIGYELDVQQVYSYKWNSDIDGFVEHNASFDFEAAKKEAERLLFQAQDFSDAIVYINQFLFTAPPEYIPATYCSSRECRKLTDWYHPYLRYLLGISYEMLDQPEQAKIVYYELWKEYPTSAFGVAASLKLEPIKP